MKSSGLIGVLLVVGTQACGQVTADPASIQAERTRIQALRQQELTRYAQEEQACSAKFLANDCLAGTKKRRREALAELLRQDIALNDAQRAHKSAQQREQRPSEPKQTDADDSASKASAADRRQRSAQEKGMAQQRSQDAAQARAHAQEQKLQEHSKHDNAAAAAKAALAAKNQRQYQKKRDEAAQHKADLLMRQKAKTKPPSLPLPDPM